MKNSKRNQQRALNAKPPPIERLYAPAPVSKYARKLRGELVENTHQANAMTEILASFSNGASFLDSAQGDDVSTEYGQ